MRAPPALPSRPSVVVALALATAALLLPLAGGCPSYAVIPDDARARLSAAQGGKLLYLKQSMYAGQFYDDDRYRLLHPRRFEELTYLRDAEGEPLVPPPADEIIPAGTRVRVERLEWADGDAVFRRPLFTPRYTTWIFLRVARARGSNVTIERAERHILLQPGGLDDEATFAQWFDATLTADDPNPWLMSLPDDQRFAIEQKRAVPGMRADALTAALGFPDRIDRAPRNGRAVQTATWGALRVELVDDIVVRVTTGAGASAPSATTSTLADVPARTIDTPSTTTDAPSTTTDTPSTTTDTPPTTTDTPPTTTDTPPTTTDTPPTTIDTPSTVAPDGGR